MIDVNSIINNRKNTLNKSIILTCNTHFALISMDFFPCSSNFTWSTTMHMHFFGISLTYHTKFNKKILLAPQSETSSFFSRFWSEFTLKQKCIFSKHFRRLVNKIWKTFMCIVVLLVKLQPQWTKSVERKAKSIWQVKIIDFSLFFSYFSIFETEKRFVLSKS